MRNFTKGLLLTSCIIGFNISANEARAEGTEISGNVSIGSDYVFRGISQTGENATIQGGLDIVAENGLYAGIWASNVNYDGSVEVDFYAGYGGSLSEGLDYDVGVLRYEYPDDAEGGAPESSFNEVYGSLSFSNVTVGFAYSPDYFAESDQSTYVYIDYELTMSNDYGLSFHYGNQSIDDNAAYGAPDYSDYSIGLSKSISEIDLSLTWFDTDLSSTECFGGDNGCDARLVFAVGKSL
ncbi:MAG: hypothetical protein ACI9CE_001185 [Flavobacterium sp.]|jgi:uncharacterized protein (TIGR02001 family)